MPWLFLVFFLFSSSVKSEPCPEGTTYESQFKKCYKYFPQTLSFLAAERTCEEIGGNLVSISNAFENSYVSGFVAGNTKNPNYWIGASLLLSNSWSWTSGSTYSYQNWANQQPSDPSQYQCASARDVDYQWTKEICGSSRPFVCQIDLNNPNESFCSSSSTPTPDPSGCFSSYTCSPGYTMFSGDCMCYKYDDTVFRSFNSATLYCSSDNAQLVKITSQEQNDFLVSLTGRTICSGYCPQIGLQCTNSSLSSCYWTDGTPLSGFNNIYPGGVPTVGNYFLNLEQGAPGVWVPEGYHNCATLCQKESVTFSQLALERDAKGLTPISPEEHYKNNFIE